MSRPAKYDVGRLTSGDESLAFRIIKKRKTLQLSDRVSVVDMHGQRAVRNLGKEESAVFDRAMPQREEAYENNYTMEVESSFSYRGKVFVSTGPALRLAVPSPNGRWIALLSETVEDQNHMPRITIFPSLGGGQSPREGDYFLDLYSIESGQRIASGHAHYDIADSPVLGLDDAGWIDGKYFISSLNYGLTRCFVGVIDELSAAGK